MKPDFKKMTANDQNTNDRFAILLRPNCSKNFSDFIHEAWWFRCCKRHHFQNNQRFQHFQYIFQQIFFFEKCLWLKFLNCA